MRTELVAIHHKSGDNIEKASSAGGCSADDLNAMDIPSSQFWY
jgi:hypothetical protein